MNRMCKPPHVGEIIKEILIIGAGLTTSELANHLQVSRATISRIINKRGGISADMAIRLSKLLPSMDAKSWLDLQSNYDIAQAIKRRKNLKIKPIKPLKTK